MFFSFPHSLQVFFLLQETSGDVWLFICICVVGFFVCLDWFTYLPFRQKCGLTLLRTYAVKNQCKLKYYKLLGGLGECPNKICFSVLSQSLWESELRFMLISAQKDCMDLLMILSSYGAVCVTGKGFQCCTVPGQLCSYWLECKAMESHNLHCQGITIEHYSLFLQ